MKFAILLPLAACLVVCGQTPQARIKIDTDRVIG